MILLSALHAIRQQLELASELESDVSYCRTLEAGNGLFTQLVSFDWSNNAGAVDAKMGLFLRKNYLLRCWVCLSFLNWIVAFTLSILLKIPPKQLEP